MLREITDNDFKKKKKKSLSAITHPLFSDKVLAF